MKEKLLKYRKKIDSVDDKIIKLLIKRFRLIEKTINYKLKNELGKIDKKREMGILQRVVKKSGRKYSQRSVKIFRTILKNSK